MNLGPSSEAVLRQLLEAGRSQQRRRRTRIGAAVASAVAAIVGSLVVLAPSPVAADVDIRIGDGVVEVELTAGATAAELTEAFADEGLVAQVETGAASPVDIGRFVGVYIEGGDADQLDVELADGSFTHFRIDEGWQGTLTITIGRAAREGEGYVRFSNPFATGNVLHCTGVLGRPLREGASALGDLEVLVRVRGANGLPEPTVGVAELRPEDRRLVVTGGVGVSDDQVILDLADGPREEERC